MKLRIFLSPAATIDPAAALPWKLFDARGNFLREAVSPAPEMPKAEDVEAILPAERVLFARLKLPRVSASTIRELLPFAVEDRLLADPSHIHGVAGTTNERGETVVAVVDREWLHAVLDGLARAGLRPKQAYCESALLAGGHEDWNLVLGPVRGMLVDDEGVSATFDRSPGFPLALRIAIDEAAARGERPKAIRVHTEGAEPLPDLARWAAEGNVALAPGTQWEVLARGHPSARSINLLEGEFAPRSQRTPRIPAAAAWLLGLIVVGQLVFAFIDEQRLRRERAHLEQRREAIFRDAFPEAKVVVDPELQMQRNVAELKRTRGLAAGDDFLAQMTRLAHGTGGRIASVEYADGKLVAR